MFAETQGSKLTNASLTWQPRYEDFDIGYFHKNPWAHLGMGWTIENRKGPEHADCSPYLNLRNIDPKWYEAAGGDVEELKKQVNDQKLYE